MSTLGPEMFPEGPVLCSGAVSLEAFATAPGGQF